MLLSDLLGERNRIRKGDRSSPQRDVFERKMAVCGRECLRRDDEGVKGEGIE